MCCPTLPAGNNRNGVPVASPTTRTRSRCTRQPMPQSHSQWLAQPQIQEQLQQSSQPTGNAGEPLGPRVTLRWKTVSSTAASEQAVAAKHSPAPTS
ncbi:MAG: hypothetical protein R3C56_12750 [Pirellulaceae bacterium]